eukprot:TRINITY_DN22176_c0_g1_i1.p1 TRINITY_DN22176_c0_g1~~TRINITY_DN22176_c0_g1_i1.p1  ORF type:complete len:562 (-),score=112.76 TRINITY_DN22176_c0_g1_i1:121-1806(-)
MLHQRSLLFLGLAIISRLCLTLSEDVAADAKTAAATERSSSSSRVSLQEVDDHSEESEAHMTFTREEIEEEKDEAMNMVAACMLLGGVVFVMSLFYLVNFPDKDIQRHSWNVISSTLSIFVAVLVFQGLRGLVEAVIVDPVAERFSEDKRALVKVMFAYLQFALIYISLQVTLAVISFGRSSRTTVKPVMGSPRDLLTPRQVTARSAGDEDSTRRSLKAMCWGTLNAHMAGFAGAHCSTDMQQMHIFSRSPLWSLVPVGIFAVFQFVLFRLSSRVKHKVAGGRLDDMKESVEIWSEYSEEAEDDAASLSLSFAAVSAVRFAVFGGLPNADGLDIPPHPHPPQKLYLFLAIGIALAILSIAIVLLQPPPTHKTGESGTLAVVEEGEGHQLEESFEAQNSFVGYLMRWSHIIESVLAMMFAWCVLFDTKHSLHNIIVRGLRHSSDPNSCVERVILALTISMGAFIVIFFLDKLQDLESTGDKADRAIGIVISSLAILVGFSWEQSFDAGVEVIAELSSSLGSMAHVSVKLCIAILVAVVMIPAWRNFILKKVLDYRLASHKSS